MPVSHSTVVVVADDGTSPVGTNEWNADHVFTGDSRVAASDLTIAASCSFVVAADYEVAAGINFELAAGAAMEVL
jgi:hypothetical protein